MKKKTVSFTTLGCKLNFSETSYISQQFEKAGYTKTDDDKPDVFVINTCTVTELANKKSKQIIKKQIKNNPNTKIVVVGCYSQLKPEEIEKIEGVDLILGSDNKFDIIDELKKIEKNKSPKIVINNRDEKEFIPAYSYGDRTRSFLKVQDGCDYYCSYCTIPKARGKSRSNSVVKTVEKAQEILDKGVKEIILTGVNIGDFGNRTDENFFELIKNLDKLKRLERLRISSIEPNLLSEQIIEFVAKSNVIVPHFHIPLQCGTDNLLKTMRRRYTTSLYKKRVNKIKSIMPDACIAADVIVGVPGETEEEFIKSCDFIKSIDISFIHVFTYSEREGTIASKMQNKVTVEDKKKRSKIMHEIADEKQNIFYKQHLGSVRRVLFESQKQDNMMYGFTDNYIKVEVPYDIELVNEIKDVFLKSITKNKTILGEVIE
jgi:threonylcarbamoyladenosine tRNA methylthiotransferase MtaB